MKAEMVQLENNVVSATAVEREGKSAFSAGSESRLLITTKDLTVH